MDQNNLDLTFNIDKSFKSTLLLGLVFFGGGLIVSLIMPFIEPKLLLIWWIWIPVIIGYLIFIKVFIDVWKQRKNYVRLNDNSISLHSPENQIEIIQWSEISEVKENNILERLMIQDKYNKTIRLEYQLENMSELLNIVAKNIPHLTKQYSQLRKFRRTNHLHIFFVIALMLISSLTIYSSYLALLFPTIILGGFSCLIVYVLLIEFIGIRLFDDGIVIIYPLWKKKIRFSQLKNISFENMRGGNGKSSPFVILKLINEKKVKLNAVREGTIALYSALNASLSAKSS